MQTVFTTVFVDILGFVALVEANEWSLDLLDSFYSSSKTLDEIRADITPSKYRRPMHPLDAVFSAFHRTLEVNIERALRASHLHSIVFSDSAFVAFEHPEIAFDFAQKTMQDMLSLEVPVRMGIGAGSFRALRFKTDTGDRIGLHASYFLGTSVTRAHGAEQCGVSGMRILLHPELVPPQDYPDQIIELPAPDKPLKLNVTQELCYLLPYSSDRDERGSEIWHEKNRNLRLAVERMRKRAPNDKKFQYDATLEAHGKMGAKLGGPIIIDWRDIDGRKDE